MHGSVITQWGRTTELRRLRITQILNLEFFPFILLAGLGILVILIILFGRKYSLAYRLCFALFGMYLLLVVRLTIFPLPFKEVTLHRPLTEILSQVNLVPFNFGHLFKNNPNVIIHEIVGNILLLMPFGFGLPFLIRFKPRIFPWLAFGAGLVIEGAQLGFNLLLGGSYRTVDINDVILNALGAMLAYVLFRGFAWLVVTVSKRIKIKPGGIFAYVYEIALRGSDKPGVDGSLHNQSNRS